MRRAAAWLLLVFALTPGAAAEESIADLVAELGSTNRSACATAYRELVRRLDPAAIPRLRKGIPTYDPIGQYYGMLVLDRYPRKQVQATWRKLSRVEVPFVRVWAGMALYRAGDERAVEDVATALAAPEVDANERLRMLSRVGWPSDPRLRDAIRSLLVPGAPVRVVVALVERLHSHRDREAIPAMRALLEDDRPGPRALAAAWLYDVGELQHETALAAALRTGIPYAELRQVAAILAANRRVDDAILDAVVEHLPKERNATLLVQQIAFLGQHRYARARPALRKLLVHPSERVARAAFDVLVTLTGPVRDEAIGPLLEGSDVDKRLWAAEALRQRDDPRGLAVAVDVLKTGTVPQRVGATTLIASFTRDDAVEPLLRALEDDHVDVRRAALAGLAKLLGRLLPYRTIRLGATGYAVEGPDTARRAAVQAIRAWWDDVRVEDW